jgi:PAS domain S-box-containing protein
LENLLETSPIAVGIISAHESRYVRVNQAMADLLGLSIAEISRRDPYRLAVQITHPDDLVAEQKLFAELAIGARRFYRIEKRFLRPDGTTRWGWLTFSGIYESPASPGSPVGQLRFAISQVVDLTEMKALRGDLERREVELRHAQKVDGIGRLAAGIAHDFNNLLTVIMGHGEALKRLDPDGARSASTLDFQESVGEILAACERAASLTAQVLAHGRREHVAPRAFVLSAAVDEWERFLGRTIGANFPLPFQIHVDRSLTAAGAILADPEQVGQVIMNLILNARDAIGEGGRISLATRDLVVIETGAGQGPPGPGAWVVLSVSDDGHGMSAEVRARIFEPFFTTRTDRPGTRGTGLGLATVQRIVSEVGGAIDVESAPGQGTTVRVFFPRVTLPASQTPLPEPSARPAPAPNSRRVLVVEDEPAVRALVANVLLGAHYQVEVARDGEEALRLLAADQAPFDLIVSDLAMPNIGGMTLARRIHDQRRSPVMLFISGYGLHPPAEVSALGRLLPKPFTPGQLLDAVHGALADSS